MTRIVAAFCVVLLACHDEQASQPTTATSAGRGASPKSPPDALRFVDRAAAAGITALNTCGAVGDQKRYTLETIGTGAALIDYDGDGRLDVFLTNGCRLENRKPVGGGGCSLYRNLGGLEFEDVTDKAQARVMGMCYGALAEDLDNDGDTDLFITRWDANVLLRNEGNGTFTDVSQQSGIVIPDRWSASAAALDADLDGDLDLFVTTYFSMGSLDPQAWDKLKCEYNGLMVVCGPKGMVPEPDQFWRNEGGLVFRDASEDSGILAAQPAFGLGVVTADFDGDGWTDIYVANDSTANQLFHNHAGKFEEIALESGLAFSEDGRAQAGMGVAAGDFDRDQKLDLFVTNFALDYSTLYHNQGDGLFQDISRSIKFGQYAYLALKWGTAFVDFDLDGYLDLFVAAGHIYAEADQRKPEQFYLQHNMIFRNTGSGNYEDVSERCGPGLKIEAVHRGAAFGDLDDDGDVDVVVAALNGKPELLVNESERRGHYLEISLIGKQSNRGGVGARVWVTPEGSPFPLSTQRMSGGSFLSTNDPRLHQGLGRAQRARVRVLWPSKIETTYDNVPADSWVEIAEGEPAVKVVRKGP